MQIQVSWHRGVPTAFLRGPTGVPEPIELSPIEVLGQDASRFLEPVIAAANLVGSATARLRLRMVAQFGEALQAVDCHELPQTSEGWQQLVLGVHDFVHTREDRKQTLLTRHISVWGAARRIFRILIDDGLMPVSVYIPSVEYKLVVEERGGGLLGDRPAKVVSHEASVDKLLLPISLSRTDAEYLDEVRDGLLSRRQVLFDCLKDYWERLRQNLEFGRTLRTSLTFAEVTAMSTESRSGRRLKQSPTESLESLAAHLINLEVLYDGSPLRSRGVLEHKPDTTALDDNTFPHLKKWPIANLLPPNFGESSSRTGLRLMWTWLGRLSQRDVAFVTALLIMLHPRWTPGALAEAVVTNRDGKLYLDLEEDGLGFEVEKRRAKAMKRETLCPLSEQILTTVLEHSSALRERLTNEKHPLARWLFLPYGEATSLGTVSVSAPKGLPYFLSGQGSRRDRWLGDFYPELESAGLGVGAIGFRKIRATEGVLEWFRTKSLRAASKKIGNSERIVLEHYLPRALILAWNTRAVRRFQNLWITVAAAEEPFLLDVTDFATLADLNRFIAGLLQAHGPNSSPLAAELHRRFALGSAGTETVRSGDLHVSLSHLSLSALYRYHAAALSSAAPTEILATVDPTTGASPSAFIQLADLLQVQLPADRNSEHRRLHEAAMEEAANAALLEPWRRLFMRRSADA